jgi:hypothetical protein
MSGTTADGRSSTIPRLGIALLLGFAGLLIQSARPLSTLASPSLNVCAACAYTTIQSAINAATGITTIYIAPGTYSESLSVPGAGSATSVTLWATPSATVDAGGSNTVLSVAPGRTVVLMNMNLTNGSELVGGGIFNEHGTVTLLGTSSVYGNVASDLGGGIYNDGGQLSLHNTSSVHDNVASDGSGIYNTSRGEQGGTVTLEDRSAVYNNTPIIIASKANRGVKPTGVVTSVGGGIDNDAGSVTLEDSSTVHDNGASAGGGIANDDMLTIQDRASVYRNAALAFGGGLASGGVVTMLGSGSVHDNVAPDGGGIFNEGTLVVRNTSSVYLNTAFGDGAGILNINLRAGQNSDSIRPLQPSSTPTVLLRDFSTVHDNTAGGDGGGIATGATSSPAFRLSSRSVRQKILPSPQVTVQDGSSVYHNSAGDEGGGVYVNNDSLLVTATGSIHDNSAAVEGGGVYNNLGTVQLTGHGSLYRNSAPSGGGIYNFDGGVAFFDNTSAHDNSAPTAGGAVYNFSDTVGEGDLFTVNFSAITHNTSLDGAAVYNADGYVELDNISSLNHNIAARYGAGIFDTTAGTITANDTSSIDHNTAGSQGGGIYAATTPSANIVLWGANAVRFNTPNNCYPVGSFPPCVG